MTKKVEDELVLVLDIAQEFHMPVQQHWLCSPDLTVEWVGFVICIDKVPSENLRPETSCPEVFHGFAQSLQANAGLVPQTGPWSLFPCPSQFSVH